MFILAVGMAGYWASGSRSEPESTAALDEPDLGRSHSIAGLEVSPEILNLGNVWENDAHVLTIPINNTTNRDIEIHNFRTSCFCMKTEPETLTIPPGQTRSIQVTLNLSLRSPNEIGQFRRPLRLAVTPDFSDNFEGLYWRITGEVRSRITLDKLNVQFGDNPTIGQPYSRQVKITTHIPCQRLLAIAEPPLLDISVEPTNEPNTHVATISPSIELGVGQFESEVRFLLETDDGILEGGVPLPVAGRVQAEPVILPRHVIFGPRELGNVEEIELSLVTLTGRQWQISRIETDSDDIQIDQLSGDHPNTLKLKHAFSKHKDQQHSITFYCVPSGSTNPHEDVVPVSIMTSYYGVDKK